MRKKTLILIIVAVLLIAALVLLFVFLGRGTRGDKTSVYKYSYTLNNSQISVSVDRRGAAGYGWNCETTNDELIAVEKTAKKTKDTFVITVSDELKLGEVQFILCSDNNAYDKIYSIWLTFIRDEEGKLSVFAEQNEALEPLQSGATVEGMNYFLSKETDGSITVFVPGEDGRNSNWSSDSDATVGVTILASDESGRAFHLSPKYDADAQYEGTHPVILRNESLGLEVHISVAFEENGMLSVDGHYAETFEPAESEESKMRNAFVSTYGEITVPDAESLEYDTGFWIIHEKGEKTSKPYGSVKFKIGDVRYEFCVSDDATVEEFSFDYKAWSESEEAVSVAGVSGMCYDSEGEKALVWSKDGRVYQLTAKRVSAEELATLASTICK